MIVGESKISKKFTLSKLNKLLDGYDKSARQMISAGEKLGEALVDILKPVVPDITFQLGDYEAGKDTLVLRSESNEGRHMLMRLSENERCLEFILKDYLPFIGKSVGLYTYIWLDKQKEKQVRQIFNDLEIGGDKLGGQNEA